MLTDGELQAYIDGELSAPDVERVETTLATDAETRARLDAIRDAGSVFSAAVGACDEPVPARPALEELRARMRPAAAAPFGWGSLARAAGLVLAAAGVASAVIPGTPVNEWVGGLWSDSPRLEVEHPVSQPAPEIAMPHAETESDPTSITIRPEAGRVSVQIPAIEAGRTVRLIAVLTSEPEARLSSSGDVPPRYAVTPGVISIAGDVPDELVVEIPRWVEEATVLVGEVVVVRKRGNGLVITAAAAGLGPALELLLTR